MWEIIVTLATPHFTCLYLFSCIKTITCYFVVLFLSVLTVVLYWIVNCSFSLRDALSSVLYKCIGFRSEMYLGEWHCVDAAGAIFLLLSHLLLLQRITLFPPEHRLRFFHFLSTVIQKCSLTPKTSTQTTFCPRKCWTDTRLLTFRSAQDPETA